MNNRQKFIHLLIHLGELEQQIEQTRILIASNEYFTLYRAFQAVDENNNNYITNEQLGNLINLDCTNIINYYTEYQSNKLAFANFMNICLPKTDIKLRQLLTSKQNRGVSPEEQELIKEHLKILLTMEYNLFQEIQLYYKQYEIQLDLLFEYPITKANIQQLLDTNGYNISADSIWRRLDYSQTNKIQLEGLFNIFTNPQEKELHASKIKLNYNIQQAQPLIPISKLGWIDKINCSYHTYNLEQTRKIKDMTQFTKTQQILKKYEWEIIIEFLNLIKEQAAINQQLNLIVQKISKLNLKEAFNKISINEELCFEGIQKFLGQQFNLEQSDYEQLQKFIGGNSYSKFKTRFNQGSKLIKIIDDQFRVLLIKLILHLQLSRYLRQQFKKKSLIQDADLLKEFGDFTQANVLGMARRVNVRLSVEEVRDFFGGMEEWDYDIVIRFLNED